MKKDTEENLDLLFCILTLLTCGLFLLFQAIWRAVENSAGSAHARSAGGKAEDNCGPYTGSFIWRP